MQGRCRLAQADGEYQYKIREGYGAFAGRKGGLAASNVREKWPKKHKIFVEKSSGRAPASSVLSGGAWVGVRVRVGLVALWVDELVGVSSLGVRVCVGQFV